MNSSAVLTPNFSAVVGALFHFFMLFVVIYSGLVIFALIRYGRSRMVGVVGSLAFMLVAGLLYLYITRLIATL